MNGMHGDGWALHETKAPHPSRAEGQDKKQTRQKKTAEFLLMDCDCWAGIGQGSDTSDDGTRMIDSPAGHVSGRDDQNGWIRVLASGRETASSTHLGT